jgi:hypothetical protein
LFLCLEADVAAPWQPVKVTSLEKKTILLHILKVIFPGVADNQFSS